jgi:hypothetical protein
MITVPTNFQTDIDNNETAKFTYIKLYYDDESDYIPFSTLTQDVDSKQSIGAIVNFIPSKSTWNWSGKNNVTITTPTLRIANIELPGYAFMDEIYNKNFMGKKVQIYVGHLAHSSTTDDMMKLYDGTVKDIDFNVNDNDINIVLESQKLLNTEIQGSLINYDVNQINGLDKPSLSSLSESNISNAYVPVVFGNNLFAPTVCIAGIVQD